MKSHGQTYYRCLLPLIDMFVQGVIWTLSYTGFKSLSRPHSPFLLQTLVEIDRQAINCNRIRTIMAHTTITTNTNKAIANIKRLANFSSSPFLHKLPPELRNAVYTFAFQYIGYRVPGLLTVCSQIRIEALPIFHLPMDIANLESCKTFEWLRAIASNPNRRFLGFMFCFRNSTAEKWFECLPDDYNFRALGDYCAMLDKCREEGASAATRLMVRDSLLRVLLIMRKSYKAARDDDC